MKAVVLGEFTTDPEVAGTMLRMRSELSQLEATVKALQFEFDDPHLLTINAGDLLHLWRLQIAPLEAEAR